MENIISKFLSEISYIAVIPLVVIAIKNIIDNRNLSDIEKLLISDWKKFKIDLSNYGVGNFILLFIGFIYMTFANPSSIDKAFPSLPIGLLVFVIIWFIFTMSFIILFNLVTWIDNNLTSNNEFYINLENEDWKVIKIKNENVLLVKKENKYMFIDDWNNKEIFSKQRNHFPLTKIYTHFPNANLMNKIIFPILLISSLSGFIFCFFIKTLMVFPTMFLSAFLILTVLIVWGDHYQYSKSNS